MILNSHFALAWLIAVQPLSVRVLIGLAGSAVFDTLGRHDVTEVVATLSGLIAVPVWLGLRRSRAHTHKHARVVAERNERSTGSDQ